MVQFPQGSDVFVASESQSYGTMCARFFSTRLHPCQSLHFPMHVPGCIVAVQESRTPSVLHTLCGENIITKILNRKKYNVEPRKIQDAYANHPNIASTGIAQTINIDAQTTSSVAPHSSTVAKTLVFTGWNEHRKYICVSSRTFVYTARTDTYTPAGSQPQYRMRQHSRAQYNLIWFLEYCCASLASRQSSSSWFLVFCLLLSSLWATPRLVALAPNCNRLSSDNSATVHSDCCASRASRQSSSSWFLLFCLLRSSLRATPRLVALIRNWRMFNFDNSATAAPKALPPLATPCLSFTDP